ncbi:MAG: CBS domain-containing protein [archaeon]
MASEGNFLEMKVSGFVEKGSLAFPDDAAEGLAGKLSDICLIDERKNFLGVILEGALLLASPKEKAKNLSFNPPSISPESTVRDALKVFASSGMQLLPVVQKGKLSGVLKLPSVIQKLPLGELTLEEVTNKHPYSIGEATPVADVREIMVRSRLGRVYVTDAAGHLTGIITHNSFLKKPGFFKKDWRRASEIMEHGVLSISPSDTVQKAAALVAKNRLRAIALVENGHLVGSVEAGLIVSKVLEKTEPVGEGIRVEILGLASLESFEKTAINSAVFGQVRKISEELGPSTIKLVFKRSRSEWEVSLTATLTGGKKILAKVSEFDALFAASEVLRTLQKRVRNG